MSKHLRDEELGPQRPSKSRRVTGEVENPGAPQLPTSNLDFTIGWICALKDEEIAALEILDEEYELFRPNKSAQDWNQYGCGRIGPYKVVIARTPDYGTAEAAQCATHLCNTFPNIKFGLLVGIGGGIDSKTHDIRLGDVVVSQPVGKYSGVLQYDYSKRIDGQLVPTGSLNRPPTYLLNAAKALETARERGRDKFDAILGELLEKSEFTRKKFRMPHLDSDQLRAEDSIARQSPQIHHGVIASGHAVVKDGQFRDDVGKECGALCFEMEAAGLMNDFPCLVIRGISDYSDAHKNDSWQPYAAATAAAYAKNLLLKVEQQDIVNVPVAKDLLNKIDTGLYAICP